MKDIRMEMIEDEILEAREREREIRRKFIKTLEPKSKREWAVAKSKATPEIRDLWRAFFARAENEYTAHELMILSAALHESRFDDGFRICWQGLTDEATALIAHIRGLGEGGDDLYDYTLANLRTLATRAMKRNAQERDIAGKLEEIKTEVKAGSDHAKAAADNSSKILEIVSRIKPEMLTGEENPPREYVKIAGTLKKKIYDLWEEYKPQHTKLRRDGTKANFDDFFLHFGGRELMSGKKLADIVPDVATLKKIIHSEQTRRLKAGKTQNQSN